MRFRQIAGGGGGARLAHTRNRETLRNEQKRKQVEREQFDPPYLESFFDDAEGDRQGIRCPGVLLDSLENSCYALSGADTHRRQTVVNISVDHRVDECRCNASSTSA